MSLPRLGLQTIVLGQKYSIEDPAVLDKVRAAGYDALETAPKDPAGFKRMLDARGMVYAGAHTGPKGLLDTRPVIEKLRVLGAHDICSSALMEWNKRSAADYAEAIPVLNRAGRELRDAGIHLHYHNHDFEFAKVEGDRTGMDLLLAGLDFGVVGLCVDVGWVTKAGLEPNDFLMAHKDIVSYLHFKDFDSEGWTELGRGEVDFGAVVDVLPNLPAVRWVMVEQDSSRIDPLESIRLSRQYLRDTFAY